MKGGSTIRATRRDVLAGGLCLCCLPVTGLAAMQADGRHAGMEEVSPGVFIRHGRHAEATSQNGGAIANIGFIIGDDQVLVTESGGSLADGQWLRDQIRQRTERPIRHVVMSHAHPDHVFGAGAFLEDRPDFIGHARLRPALEARGDYYRERLAELIGPEDTGPVVLPTREIGEEGSEVELGGRRLRFHAHGTAHSDADLSIVDPAAGLVFSADLLFVDRVPALDGSLIGWLRELDLIEAQQPRHLVPGHGPALVAPEALAPQRRYLLALREGVRKAIRDNVPIERARETVATGERGKWRLFDENHARNVIQAYKELEWE